MKIFLTTSYLGGHEPLVFPLGLACLKAFLVEHEVCAMDLNTMKNPYPVLVEKIRTFQPDVVGISLRNIDSTNKRVVRFYYAYLREIINKISKETSAKIVIGGSGFSMFAETIMKQEPLIHFGVYLEGERTFLALLENLDRPENVPGVFYRKNGAVRFSGTPEIREFNDAIMPDFGVVSMRPYRKFRNAVGVETKRGCAFKCIYCIYPFLNGRRYRLKSPEVIVDELQALSDQYDVHQFMFVDSVFNQPAAHALAICEEIIRRRVKIKWSAWLSEKNLDDQFVRIMVEAGCRHAIFSPDALDDHVLKVLGKNIRRKDIMKVLKIVANYKELEIGYNFFKNPPGQNVKNFLLILGFVLKNKLLYKHRIHFELNAMRIEPHTGLYDIALEERQIKTSTNLLYPCYYINQRSRLMEGFFNILLRLKGK